MDLPPLPAHLQQVLTDDLRGRLIACLERAYQTTIDNHDEENGSNEQTFGFNLYHFNTHEFTREARREGGYQVRHNKLFRIVVGPITFACHRVGRNGSDDIWTSYPSNDDAVMRMAERSQLLLPGFETQETLADTSEFMIAHLGNADRGLEAVYITAPRKNSDGNIEWAHAFELWKRTEHDAGPRLDPIPNSIEPEIEIQDEILLRKRHSGTTI